MNHIKTTRLKSPKTLNISPALSLIRIVITVLFLLFRSFGMDQELPQAQLKLPQAKVCAVSHNLKLSIFFFFQWKTVVIGLKSHLIIFRKWWRADCWPQRLRVPPISTYPSRASLGGSQGQSPSAEGTICWDVQHKQTQRRRENRSYGEVTGPASHLSWGRIRPNGPSASLLASQLTFAFMQCQADGHHGRCCVLNCSLLCQSVGTAEGSASP